MNFLKKMYTIFISKYMFIQIVKKETKYIETSSSNNRTNLIKALTSSRIHLESCGVEIFHLFVGHHRRLDIEQNLN